jgi:hypothetical protein
VLLVLAPALAQGAHLVPVTLLGRLALRLVGVAHRQLVPRERLAVLKRSHAPVSGSAPSTAYEVMSRTALVGATTTVERSHG